MSQFFIPKANIIHETIVQKSRFIAYVFRAFTTEEADQYIESVKVEHPRANHHVVAYLIGDPGNEAGKADDDGEPKGTSGMPILDVLKKQKISNCLVVVVRYFGGVMLGAGGLVRAYSSSASEALAMVGLNEYVLLTRLHLTFDYALFDMLQSKMKAEGYPVGRVDYTHHIEMEIFVPKEKIDHVQSWLVGLTNDNIEIAVKSASYQELVR